MIPRKQETNEVSPMITSTYCRVFRLQLRKGKLGVAWGETSDGFLELRKWIWELPKPRWLNLQGRGPEMRELQRERDRKGEHAMEVFCYS